MTVCPDCNHPIEQHDEFFCMHVYCMCNQGKITAKARADRALYAKMLDVAKNALDIAGDRICRDALDEILRMEEQL